MCDTFYLRKKVDVSLSLSQKVTWFCPIIRLILSLSLSLFVSVFLCVSRSVNTGCWVGFGEPGRVVAHQASRSVLPALRLQPAEESATYGCYGWDTTNTHIIHSLSTQIEWHKHSRQQFCLYTAVLCLVSKILRTSLSREG